MLLHKTFGVDLGTSTIKIYAQDKDTIITEKNIICLILLYLIHIAKSDCSVRK